MGLNTATPLTIGEGTKVTLYFALKLENGDVIDSNFESSPATFDYGDGSLLPGFEKKLEGLIAGEHATFEVAPDEGFGLPNDENIKQFKRTDFADDMPMDVGSVISFSDMSNNELPGVIKGVDGNQVTVDFNHPLSGKTIVFDVEIIDVIAAAPLN